MTLYCYHDRHDDCRGKVGIAGGDARPDCTCPCHRDADDVAYDTWVAWCKAEGLRLDGRCGRCAGTGQFITYIENGVPKGPGGPCYRCGGKGWQSVADTRRNYGHDNFAPIYGI